MLFRSRWVSVVVSPTPHKAFNVFDIVRETDDKEIIRFAVNLHSAEVVNSDTYPSLDNSTAIKRVLYYPSLRSYKSDVYVGQVHSFRISWKRSDGKTHIICENSLKNSLVFGAFEVVLDGDWGLSGVISEDMTEEENNFSCIRFYKIDDKKNGWQSPKMDILINPWGAHIKEGPCYGDSCDEGSPERIKEWPVIE